MIDVDKLEAPESSATVNSPSAHSISRPSSVGLETRSVSMSASGRGTPTMPRPDGPSGGAAGLDENKMCGICGSGDHFTHNCVNTDAKEVARGKCFRCKQDGHNKGACTAERCLECGQFDHSSAKCKSSKTLSKYERSRLVYEERNFRERQKEDAERRRQQQMGGHNPKVPVIQTTTNNSIKVKPDELLGSKRKRTDSPIGAAKASRPRIGSNPPSNAPKGPATPTAPRAVSPTVDIVVNTENSSILGSHQTITPQSGIPARRKPIRIGWSVNWAPSHRGMLLRGLLGLFNFRVPSDRLHTF